MAAVVTQLSDGPSDLEPGFPLLSGYLMLPKQIYTQRLLVPTVDFFLAPF